MTHSAAHRYLKRASDVSYQDDLPLATSLGANGFFTKPYVKDKFLRDIEDFIHNWQ